MPGGEPVRVEKRANKFNQRMTPSAGIEQGRYLWKASFFAPNPTP